MSNHADVCVCRGVAAFKARELLRIVIRRQLRQRGYGVIMSISMGICVYLCMAVLGGGIEERISQDVSLLGNASVITATFEEYRHPAVPARAFTPQTLEMIRSRPEVLAAAACMRFPAPAAMPRGGIFDTFSVLGVGPGYWEAQSLHAEEGRLLTEDDENTRARVCVLGKRLAQRLLGDGPYAGRIITLFNDNYTVAGVGGGLLMRGKADWCFIPLATAVARRFHDAAANRLILRVRHLDQTRPLAEGLPQLVALQQDAAYLKVEYARDELDKIQTIRFWVRFLLWLGVFGALALGCLGIWQGAFASVRQRTREIGLQFAIGAERADIVFQFLTESLCKSLIGGFAGICLAVLMISACAAGGEIPLHWQDIVRGLALSLTAAVLVGAAGGAYPAYLAGKMDIVSALRHE